ncbi:MAG: hypothetical protein UU47_C0014G0028 [candidate division TM6 bacterium GW2011_GWE2_41_16]|nr:MAG: hypothetical protein UU47_C0014G0028 [candidate division TM6 bacterium GW2011_GWE2_41_16]
MSFRTILISSCIVSLSAFSLQGMQLPDSQYHTPPNSPRIVSEIQTKGFASFLSRGLRTPYNEFMAAAANGIVSTMQEFQTQVSSEVLSRGVISACSNGHAHVLAAFVMHSFLDPNAQEDETKMTALMYAIKNGDTVGASALIALPTIDLNIPDSHGHIARDYARLHGNVAVTAAIMRKIAR